ncbi:MAG: hypothetical protein E7179_04485 [Erysipelotrichaceae bacterium]|jgi:hypothetical protein|nr:hypothetical protein [Erysipelotrichaceae bacterium]
MESNEALALKAQIEQAKKQTSAAKEKVDDSKARLAKVANVSLSIDESFPLTDAVLVKIEENQKKMEAYRNEMEALLNSAEAVNQGVDAIANFAAEVEAVLRGVRHLDKRGRYDEAFDLLEAILQPILDFDYGIDLPIKEDAHDVYLWTKAALFAHKGEANIEQDLPPLTPEEEKEYIELAGSLPLSIRGEHAKNYHIDKANGFAFLLYAKEEREKPHTRQTFEDLLTKIDPIYALEGKMSTLTESRADVLKQCAIEEFNELSYRSFEETRDFEECLYYFRNKDIVAHDDIVHMAYREANDERQFKLFFLESEAIKNGAEQFRIDSRALASGEIGEDEFDLTVLAHYFALRALDETKFQILLAELKALSFERLVVVVGKAYALGADEARKAAGLDLLVAHKKKKGNIEVMAEHLICIESSLPEEEKKRMSDIIRDLMRSPHSKKVCDKSTNPSAHQLLSQNPADFPKPLGKPIKNPKVSSWDPLDKFLYIALAVATPIIVAVFLFILIFFSKFPSPGRLLYLVPFAIVFLTVDIAIVYRYGRDERKSEIVRRVIGFDAFWKAVLAMAFFLAPKVLVPVGEFGYALAAAAAIEGLWGILFYKDRSKVAGFAFYLPTLLMEIVTVIMIVVDSVNGWI